MTFSSQHHTLTLVFPEGAKITSNKVMAALHPLGVAMQPDPGGKVFRAKLDVPLSVEELKAKCPQLKDLPAHAVFIQKVNQQGLKIACFDMDSTIIQNECINEMARQCDIKAERDPEAEGSCYQQVLKITNGQMNGHQEPNTPRPPKKSFEVSLKERLEIIAQAGFTDADLPDCFERIRLMPGAIDLLAHLKENKVRTVLVSGGFSQFVEQVQQQLNAETPALGFDETYCNTLTFDDQGKLTGAIGSEKLQTFMQAEYPPIVGEVAKAAVIQKESEEQGVAPANMAMTGDGGNDRNAVAKVVAAGGAGIAYHATNPDLRAAANGEVPKESNLASLIALQWQGKMQSRIRKENSLLCL